MNNNITIIFVTFYSNKKLLKYLNQFKNKFKIIIIDNSQNKKINLLKKKNINIIINKKNLGFGSSVNIGLKQIKTKYALHLDLDTSISNQSITRLVNQADMIKDFAILTPKIKNFSYKEKDFITKKIYANVNNMSFVDGCCLLFNMKEIKKIGYFDENFFLYFEETDLLKRFLNKSKKILMVDNISIFHKGRSSSEAKFNYEIELNRNWHYMWSKFYYFRKHYGYLFGFFKIFNHFYSSFFKYIFYALLAKEKEKMIYFSRFSGCLNSLMLKKAWYRPDIYKQVKKIN